MSPDFIDLIPGPVRTRIRQSGFPDVGYALAGIVDLAHAEVTALPDTIGSAPASAWSLANGQANVAWSEGVKLAGALRAVADETYVSFVERGERRVVEVSTERAVRRKVGRMQDNVAPKAARAAVRVQHRRRWLRESPRIQTAVTTAQQTHQAARRSADRFAEMNAPVLADPE